MVKCTGLLISAGLGRVRGLGASLAPRRSQVHSGFVAVRKLGAFVAAAVPAVAAATAGQRQSALCATQKCGRLCTAARGCSGQSERRGWGVSDRAGGITAPQRRAPRAPLRMPSQTPSAFVSRLVNTRATRRQGKAGPSWRRARAAAAAARGLALVLWSDARSGNPAMRLAG